MSVGAASVRAVPSPLDHQITIDELGCPLREVTFVVVDLETTGGSPSSGAITEIAAVKVRGGEVLGELQTLVNPGQPIPPFIAVLTGITEMMVREAPSIGAVLPTFLEFLGRNILVAHNAPFDVGFLRAACAAHGYEWPPVEILDTARLARRVFTRDEAPNCTLSTLARLVRTSHPPTHRALDDARATVDVLHAMLERLGSLGVHSWDDLRTYTAQVTAAQRRKRHLADRLPNAAGVYVFRDRRGQVLYVGKAKNIRQRVRSYFTAAETRRHVIDMIHAAEDVTPIVCANELEAEVRELRIIAEHKPPYNRRSKFPERVSWVKLTSERFPRLTIVPVVRDDAACYLGPFSSRDAAQRAIEALYDAFPLRRCTERLGPRTRRPACALAELGRCGAPCEGRQTAAEYAAVAASVRRAMTCDPSVVIDTAASRIRALANSLRYEEAAEVRDRLLHFLRAVGRSQRLAALAGCPQIVAVRPQENGETEVAVIRHGRLAGADRIPSRHPTASSIAAVVATAETPLAVGYGTLAYAGVEEMECILRWLEHPATRLVDVTGTWALPLPGFPASLPRLFSSARPVETRRVEKTSDAA